MNYVFLENSKEVNWHTVATFERNVGRPLLCFEWDNKRQQKRSLKKTVKAILISIFVNIKTTRHALKIIGNQLIYLLFIQ